MVTHEAGHALFHADRVEKGGLLTARRVVSAHQDARDKALMAASERAVRDGISPNDVVGSISGYAKSAGTREEIEAELFSQYHWSPRPPAFVQVWGQTLHQEMGVDATPFREAGK